MEYILIMIINHSTPGAVPPQQLAQEILRVSQVYRVNPVLLTSIAMTESHGQAYAYNVDSDDHGLMQINAKTALNRHISDTCLYNWRCNLAAAAKLISEESSKAGWKPCMYNTGRLGAKRNANLCLQYERKLASIY